MNLYKNIKNFGEKTIKIGSIMAILAGCAQPTLEQNKDLTGDGLPDAIVNIKNGHQAGTWLFIGQNDGSFLRARKYVLDDISYFKTDDGIVYFFDGKLYRQLPKQK